ncbi:conserved hypothetical protein [Gloeothece citriformis PCC 7424]|uniref:Uncharacterized protein n=1 Tax=Gloeothece citriformis (strain PCC 7424) TaxID=65393 RepID=B7KB80_GLOC7|nr:hypothetical protein [Gloeothece citriformis]ACK71436.1 conserved hypothetical protein [Gloeothece citriformis PCC 7424]
MEAFSPTPPPWLEKAIHATNFCCPRCRASAAKAQRVWINRRAPVLGEDYRRKWQEFYLCECEQAWWAWSSDRPPSEFSKPDE